jgi:hypothetical protein
VIAYAVVDDLSSPEHPVGEAVEVFIRREDAERFIDEVRGNEPEFAAHHLRIESGSSRRRQVAPFYPGCVRREFASALPRTG